MISARPGDAASGKPPPMILPSVQMIGRHAIALLRAAIGEAEAGDDLVEDQHTRGGRRARAGLQEAGLGRDDPLQRLDDDRGDIAPCSASSEATAAVVEGRDQHLVAHALGDAGAVGHGVGKIDLPLGARLICASALMP
jgi:hypothetical protein